MSQTSNALTTVLIVDDEPAVRDLMARWVTSLGLQPTTAANAEEAIETLRTRHHDLAVIDVMMPGKNGLWLAGEVRRDHPNTAVVIATAYTELLEQAPPDTPIADLLIKPFKRERFVLAVDRGREWCRQAVSELEWHAKLSNELRTRIDEICARVDRAHEAGAKDAETLMAMAVERTKAVVEHGERVARFALAVAQEMKLAKEIWTELQLAARFHDIGKMAIPEALLTKPSPLTPGEVAIMRRHVNAGAEILDRTRELCGIEPVVHASHEWFGGGGYPERLQGPAIPLASRIISVCDAYDAMTHDRAYRARLDSAEAVSELLRCAPAQFDPEVVIAFLNVLGRH
ncbi:MAG TPA: HD domain-containing phosphohydrolase [Vicinamibacterales bacterium]|jgi:putative nucleotidyltransferase with HDIG domain|nr:HD domain-containing phosphohydrolase [Vicinamibacterales bacterium]